MGEVSAPNLGCFTCGKERWYPLYRKMGGTQGWLDVFWKSFPHWGSNHDLLYWLYYAGL